MQLYTFPQSHNSLRVTATAYGAGIALEPRFVDLAKAEQHKPEFLKLNPNHKVPTLVDGDFVLWESPAIMLYLAERNPAAGLVPRDLHQRMHMHQWIAWDTMQFTPAEHVYIYEYRVKSKLRLGEPDSVRLEAAAKNYHEYAAVLDGHLKGRTWLVGNTCTLADFHVVAPMIHAASCHFPLTGYREIRRWSDHVFQTQAWQQAYTDAYGR
ncbi:MAG: glutathione S-transferase family protein [Gammaproteobacteria bacterium]|nr:glutathione S-transferase family protein [Gammaproteobacteria bacterium]